MSVFLEGFEAAAEDVESELIDNQWTASTFSQLFSATLLLQPTLVSVIYFTLGPVLLTD